MNNNNRIGDRFSHEGTTYEIQYVEEPSNLYGVINTYNQEETVMPWCVVEKEIKKKKWSPGGVYWWITIVGIIILFILGN